MNRRRPPKKFGAKIHTMFKIMTVKRWESRFGEVVGRSDVLIGTILFDLGYIHHEQIDKVLEALEIQQT